jgi:hypothetical protein
VGILFFLLEISALAGAALRLLTRLFTGDLQDIDFPLLATSFSISLVLAWALGIAYLAIGQDFLSNSQSASILPSHNLGTQVGLTVQSLGIRMGLLGLIAGFLTESGLEGLRKYLDRVIGSFKPQQ